MVARISTLKSISKVLNYNEQKVHAGKAELIHASSFLKDAAALTFYDKVWHFDRLTSLNEKVGTNVLHVSLNFDPTEQPQKEKLIQIAAAYMTGIGFGEQPYLVYEHEDAGHPHIHIVSTNIRSDGSRISMHNLGRNQSEKCRKEIEVSFNLVKAGDKTPIDSSKIQAIDATKAIYGKSETRGAISNVLRTVLHQYNYVSLEQLNAVLKLYNVIADRGEKDSRMFKQGGIQYSVLDEKGSKVGIPINASRFFMKPTLPFLEKKYTENEAARQLLKKRMKTALDWTLQKNPASLTELMRALEKENITTVVRKNKEGVIYGITYIDHKAKVVFNGSEIGKAYSAKSILARCPAVGNQETPAKGKKRSAVSKTSPMPSQPDTPDKVSTSTDLISLLIEPEFGTDQVPYPLKGKKRKKRRRMKL